MSFIRPEARAGLLRWREALVGALVLGLGLWIMAEGRGLVFAAGAIVALIGVALIVTGARHALFTAGALAPGIVEVVEGRVTYLGPVLGGSVALQELTEVTYRMTAGGEAFWRLSAMDGQPLIIPAGAEGVEALLDACALLPNFNQGLMIKAVHMRRAGALTVWRREGVGALT